MLYLKPPKNGQRLAGLVKSEIQNLKSEIESTHFSRGVPFQVLFTYLRSIRDFFPDLGVFTV